MTSSDFVSGLKAAIREGVDFEIKYLDNPPSSNPPEHLRRFALWFQRLSSYDKTCVEELLLYVAEGGLFRLLTYLDNIGDLRGGRGRFELWYFDENGGKVLLNDPGGDLLNELFNTV